MNARDIALYTLRVSTLLLWIAPYGRELAPAGIDVYFDNVGGDHLQAAIGALRVHGRITLCLMTSTYTATDSVPGPNNLMLLATRRLRMCGFMVYDHIGRQAAVRQTIGDYVRAGRITVYETIVDGIERAPQAFLALLRGEHAGKVCVRLAPDQGGS